MRLIERLRDAAFSRHAQDGGLDGVPREWREEADYWQAELTDADLMTLLDQAMSGEHHWRGESLWEVVADLAAERHADDWREEQARREREEEEEEFQQWQACKQAVEAAVAAYEEATGVVLRPSSFGAISHYGAYENDHVCVEIRISDHDQPAGGGWNEGTGKRFGEARISYTVAPDNPLPDRATLRRDLAAAIREELAVHV